MDIEHNNSTITAPENETKQVRSVPPLPFPLAPSPFRQKSGTPSIEGKSRMGWAAAECGHAAAYQVYCYGNCCERSRHYFTAIGTNLLHHE